MKITFRVLVILLCLGIAAQAADQVIALKAARMFDGKSNTLVQNAVVIVRGDKIVDAGSNLPVPNGAQVVQSSFTSLTFTPTTRTRTVNILNNGLATRGIASVQMIGVNPSMFSVSPQTAFSLTAGTLQTMTVIFSPGTSTGTKTATLQLTTNDPATPVINVTLSGT